MSFLDGLRHRLHLFAHARDHERELRDELAFHVEREAAQQAHDSESLTESDAIAAARRQVGNLTYAQEETRRASGLAVLDVIAQDVRFAIRTFRSTPAFTSVVVITLALGIGATTAIFSAVDALLLRPLPFREPDQLMSVTLTVPALGNRPARDDLVWSYPKFLAFKSQQQVYSDLTLWRPSQFTLRGGGEARRVEGDFTDSRFFPLLGIPIALGRNFSADEDREIGGPRVAILSHQIWRSMFNADSTVIGRTVEVDGYTHLVVGVAGAGFHGVSGKSSLFMPVTAGPAGWGAQDAYSHNYFVIGRRGPGVTPEQAIAAVRVIGAQVDALYPERMRANFHWGATAQSLDATRAHPQVRRTLFILLGAVALVLLTACANVANLMLVRASGRQREVAVRLALGATRSRLVRQLLAESLVLAVVGGLASIVVAFGSVTLLARMQQHVLGEFHSNTGMVTVSLSAIRFDVVAFLCIGVLAVGTGFLFGLVPALQSTRASVTGALKDSGNTVSIGRRRFSPRHALTIAEIAFAVVLLAASGLMIQSVRHLLDVRTGFDASQLLSFRINRAPEWSRDSIDTFYDLSLERLGALPGVGGVAMGDCPPLNVCAMTGLIRPDRAPLPVNEVPRTGVHWITPDWPNVMRVPLLQGRLFTRGDDMKSRRVVLINETAARNIWPNEDPIGRPVMLGESANGNDTAWVAGVVGDVRYHSIDSVASADVYLSYYQTHLTYRMMFFIRATGAPTTVTNSAVGALREFAPGFPVHDVRSLSDRVSDATAYARITTVMLVSFAAVALILAMIGTYGVVAYSVSQRTREIGVRVALGATRAHISRLVIWQGITLASAGVAIGLSFALVATRALRSLLFGVTPTDPVTLAGIVCVLGVAVLVATWIPARRAMRVTPGEVLRAQ